MPCPHDTLRGIDSAVPGRKTPHAVYQCVACGAVLFVPILLEPGPDLILQLASSIRRKGDGHV